MKFALLLVLSVYLRACLPRVRAFLRATARVYNITVAAARYILIQQLCTLVLRASSIRRSRAHRALMNRHYYL